MIQRIQSLFLVISVAISASTFILPFGEKLDNEGQMQMLSLLGNATHEPNYGLILVNVLVLLVAVVAIFNFKRRA
ncbi:MAG: DUF4293 family protein, partial [Bacteroidota bacterium]